MGIASLIISIIGIVIAIIALILSGISSSKANKISNEQLKINNAIIETEIRKAIEEANSRVNDMGIEMVPYAAKIECNQGTPVDKKTLEMYQTNFVASVQAMLNVYDDACTKYLDKKIDCERFKRNFFIEIRNLIERESLKEYFDPTTSRYKAILKVYDEWENLEK
ncbi:hypothetical protein ES702_01898 [subsurface metagenome]